MQDATGDGPVPGGAAAATDDREALLGTLAPVLDAVARVHG